MIIRPGAIGDVIVSLPALKSLKAQYTEVWCPSAVVPLIRFADRVVSIAGSGLDRVAVTHCDDVLSKLAEFGEIHSWYGTRRADFREACAHLPIHFYQALPVEPSLHAVDFYLAQLRLPLGGSPRVKVDRNQKPTFAILHPFSGSSRKNWPRERWSELAHLLSSRMCVRWCAGPEDYLPKAVTLPNLDDLAKWIGQAHLFIGNDSGITHLAAATGTPTIALFGPTDPAIWAPRGRAVTVIHRQPIEDITAREVAEAVP